MRMIIHSSLWGINYRHRVFVDGVRISYSDSFKYKIEETISRESGGGWFRVTYKVSKED